MPMPAGTARYCEHAGKIEAPLKAEVAELLARAEAADQTDVSDGMLIPVARRKERLAKLAEARAKRRSHPAECNDCHSSTPS